MEKKMVQLAAFESVPVPTTIAALAYQTATGQQRRIVVKSDRR